MSTLKKKLSKFNIIQNYRIRKERRRLSGKAFTILSSNCLGGLIYHELGLEFTSPTINLRFSSKDFVKFVLNIDHYLECSFVQIDSGEAFPVARLDDILVFFVHYNSFEKAVSDWEKRKKRIVWDNVFVILNDCDGVNEADMIALDNSQFYNTVVFSSKEHSNIKCTFFIERYKNEPCVGNLMEKDHITGEMVVEKHFDFVGWFNQENGRDLAAYRK